MVYTKSFPRNPENAVRIIQKPELLMQHAMPIFSDPLFSYNNLSCTHLLEKLCLKDFLSSLINNKTAPLDKLQEGNCDFFSGYAAYKKDGKFVQIEIWKYLKVFCMFFYYIS